MPMISIVFGSRVWKFLLGKFQGPPIVEPPFPKASHTIPIVPGILMGVVWVAGGPTIGVTGIFLDFLGQKKQWRAVQWIFRAKAVKSHPKKKFPPLTNVH